MNRSMSRVALPAALTALVFVAGCGVTEETKQQVARSETAIQQASQTLANTEAGAIDLQRAKDHLSHAKKAVEDGDDETASRYAQYAYLDADLALARSQSDTARKAANDMKASIQTLRQEAGLPVSR
jgi:hypothetical protein